MEGDAPEEKPQLEPPPPQQQQQTTHNNNNNNNNNISAKPDDDNKTTTDPQPNGNHNHININNDTPRDKKAAPSLLHHGSAAANGNATPMTTTRSSLKRAASMALDPIVTRSCNGVKKPKLLDDEDEAGTREEQIEFMKELDAFYKERHMDFKPPKFYGEPLNLLKLWRSVLQLGGYDRVTNNKIWRQVGESFHPPKTCTTVSWTFRIFYEKSLLEFEKYKLEIGELEFPPAPESTAAENENTASGRARRDSAARAMQGWHAPQLHSAGDAGEPIGKDKSIGIGSAQKREKHLKNIGVKQKKPSNMEPTESDMHAGTIKQLVTTVVDVGPPADWVKVNVRESKDCFEVYALVPGLLREEVQVQSDPSGRLIITGQPEQLDNPWGITPFRKVVNLPARIDPLHTAAVVSLHGRLFVRVPFDRSST